MVGVSIGIWSLIWLILESRLCLKVSSSGLLIHSSWSVEPLLSNQFLFFFLCMKVCCPTLKPTKAGKCFQFFWLLQWNYLNVISVWLCQCRVGKYRAHSQRIETHLLRLVQRLVKKMTARTSWRSLWKPSLHRGTELLKYQTQRWIPLQTCSLFFTVGLRMSVKQLHTPDK